VSIHIFPDGQEISDFKKLLVFFLIPIVYNFEPSLRALVPKTIWVGTFENPENILPINVLSIFVDF